MTVSAQHLQMVEETERHSKYHVDDPQDDRHFHLKWVKEGQFIGGKIPDLQSGEKQRSHYDL